MTTATKQIIIFLIILLISISLFVVGSLYTTNPCYTVGDTVTLTEEELVKCQSINFLAL